MVSSGSSSLSDIQEEPTILAAAPEPSGWQPQYHESSPVATYASIAVLVAIFGAALYYIYIRRCNHRQRRKEEQVRWAVLASMMAAAIGAVSVTYFRLRREAMEAATVMREHKEVFWQAGIFTFVVNVAVLAILYKMYFTGGGISMLDTLKWISIMCLSAFYLCFLNILKETWSSRSLQL